MSDDAPEVTQRRCPHCSGEHPPHLLKCTETDMVLPLGGRVLDGKFRLIRQIGKGGMASVWLAVNTRVERTVAIKLIRPEVVRRTDTVKRFRSEARAAGRIGHANICDILDIGDSPIGPYIVMEYLKGRSLSEWIRRDGPLPVGTAVHVVRQALAGLAAAHREGIIHRDLKPENVFIHEPDDGEPVVKLMDFGVSKFTDGSSEVETADGALLGTPEYMSPEQFKGAAYADERTDVWAMGAILYRALTGKNAFAGPTIAATLLLVSSEDPTPVRTHNPEVPVGLAAVIERCLDKTAERRYPTANALSEALRPFEDGETLPAAASVPLGRKRAGRSDDALTRLQTTRRQAVVGSRVPRSLDRRALGILALLALGLAVAGWWALRERVPAQDASDRDSSHVAVDTTPQLPRESDGDTDAAPAAAATGDAATMPAAASSGGSSGAVGTGAASSSTGGPATGDDTTAGDGADTETLVIVDPEDDGPSTGGLADPLATTGDTPADPPDPSADDGGAHVPHPTGPSPTDDPPPDPAGTARFGRYIVLLSAGPSGDQADARRYCDKLAASGHLGVRGWTLAGLTIADTFKGSKRIKRGTYWTAARWQGRARTIKLPSGEQKPRDAKRYKARPLCVAKWP